MLKTETSIGLVTLFSLAGLLTPAFAQGVNSYRPASSGPVYLGPGTINDAEGQAAVDGKELAGRSGGYVVLAPGQKLATGNGKAEVTLRPGIYLRLDKDSVVKMISPDLSRTELELDHGRAEIEADVFAEKSDLQVDLPSGARATVKERGLYEFDAKDGELRVFDGKAAVQQTVGGKEVTVKGGHELALNGSSEKSNGFDRDGVQDAFLTWGANRSQQDYANQRYAFAGNEDGWAGGYGYPLYAGYYPGFYGYGYPFYGPAFFVGGGFGYGGFYGGGFRGGFRR